MNDVFNRAQAADYLQVCEATVTRLVREGGLRHVRLGNRLRIRREWCDQWLETNASDAAPVTAEALFQGRGR